MHFNKLDLVRAQKEGIISLETLNNLLEYFNSLSKQNSNGEKTKELSVSNKPQYNIENFLYYFGGFIIISTMGWYLGSIWNNFAHGGVLVISILYFLLFVLVGNFLWKKDKKTPGGLLYVCAVSIIPLLVWAFESLIGIMPKDLNKYNEFHILVRGGWIFMEIATIIVGFIFFKYRKFPLLTLPICYAMWFLSMDIVPLCLGQAIEPTWEMRKFSTFIFSMIMLGAAFKMDRNKQKTVDYSHWLYIFGAIMFWGVLVSVLFQFKWNVEFTRFLIAIFSIVYMLISVLLKRKIFMIIGALSFWSYLGYLSFVLFKNTLIFPIVLVALGLLVIFFGIYYSKNCNILEDNIRKFLGIDNNKLK